MVDPDKAIRRMMLDCFETEIVELNHLGVQALIGDTSCIDFTIYHKGDNVRRFVEQIGWCKGECIYLGDALLPGGNDYSVVGVIPTLAVLSPKECEDAIRSFVNDFAS